MNRKYIVKSIVLFLLFFSFQWFAQYSAAQLAKKETNLFFFLLYGAFFLRAIVWVEIIRDRKLISAYSFSSLSYLFIPLLSGFILGEEYKSSYFPAGLLILGGVFLFSVGEDKQKQLQEYS